MLRRIIAAACILIVLQILGPDGFDALFGAAGRWVRLTCFLGNYLLIGYDILQNAWRGIRNGRVFDENFLMAIATVGAMALAIYENGDYLEAIAVMLFYQIGEWFQSYAVGKSRRSITELMDIRPDHANIERGGTLEQVDPEEVAVGSIIIVQPGEKIPLDGTVVEGTSSLNTAALTGESLPRDVSAGDDVLSGCIAMTGLLKIKTTREFGESTVSKILDLVENASSRKSRSEDFIAKFARVYTPAVCSAALALFLLPPVVSLMMGNAAGWGRWLYRALTFLVISCPCALVISIPLSFFAGLGGASREGVLVKGSNYLEALSKVRWIAFDKTGTLTKGVFEVIEVSPAALDADRLLELATLAESSSSHPISKSLQQAYGKTLDRSRVSDIHEVPGMGVSAAVDGIPVAVGNDKLMVSLGLPCPAALDTGTVVHVAVDGGYGGYILIADTMKPGVKEAMDSLRRGGITQTVMLTGDNDAVAQKVAADLGISQVYSRLLPGDKVTVVEKLLADAARSGKLAFVGDGINDAPVLARADIGIAMGAMGSDAAIEAADVVLMDDDPRKLSRAIAISRKCMGIVYQNIVFALTVKLVCLLLGAQGIGGMYLAIFADVGVMVLAVLNAMRCLSSKKSF